MTPTSARPVRRTLDYPVAYAHARAGNGPVRAQVCTYMDGDAEAPGDLRAPLGYITAANGLFVRAQNGLFAATLPLLAFPGETMRGLASLTAQITLRVPPPPLSFLGIMMAEAQEIARTSGDEALWQVQWCAADEQWDEGQEPERGDWRLLRPHQTRTPGSVIYDASAPDVVLTMHSHGRLHAFFSTIDDRDDGGLSFQAVLGDLLSSTPTLRFRVCLFGYRWEVPAAVLFAPDDTIARLVSGLPPLFAPGRWTARDSPVEHARPAGRAVGLSLAITEQPGTTACAGEAAATWQARSRVVLRLLRDCVIGCRGEKRP